MKTSGNTGQVSGTEASPQDPDFNDEVLGNSSIDPDATEFRDALQVGSYASVGALQTEVDRERQEAEQATLNVLEAMRAMDAGDQIKWRISRSGHEVDELNGYLETWPNHLMTIERLRDKFGGGTYYCKGFRKGKYCSHETLQISGEAKRKPSPDGMTGSVPVAPAGPQFDVQAFLTAQERRDERRRDEEARERREREALEDKRRAERLQLLLTLGPAAITALGGLFQGRPDNTAALVAALKPPDPFTMLTQLKALQGNGQDQTLNRILPMLIEMAGSKAAGGDTGWLDVIKEFAKGAGPAVGSLIQHQLTQPPAAPGMSVLPATGPSNPQPTGALPASSMNSMPATDGISRSSMLVVPESIPRRERPRRTAPDPSTAAPPVDGSRGRPAATAASPSPSNPGSGEMNLLSLLPHLPWLKEMLGRLLAAAARGKDPEVYAALFLEEVPEEITAEHIVGLLAPENWFQQLCQLEPRWNDARVYPWIEHVRKLILNQLYGPFGAAGAAPQGAAHDTPAAVSQSSAPAAPAPRTAPRSTEVERPTKLPSLTGD